MLDYAKMIEALQLAKVRIENEESRYVCYALAEVAFENPTLVQSVRDVKGWISDSLGGSGASVWSWGTSTGVMPEDLDVHDPRLREYRLAWIDDMIKNLKG